MEAHRVEPSIECDELYGLLEDEELVVVDCRREEDWRHHPVHIPGALHMSMSDLFRSAHILPEDELIVVCGLAPDDTDSTRACRLLRHRGREAVCLAGGLQAWLRTGLPTEAHEGNPARAEGVSSPR